MRASRPPELPVSQPIRKQIGQGNSVERVWSSQPVLVDLKADCVFSQCQDEGCDGGRFFRRDRSFFSKAKGWFFGTGGGLSVRGTGGVGGTTVLHAEEKKCMSHHSLNHCGHVVGKDAAIWSGGAEDGSRRTLFCGRRGLGGHR